MRYDVFLLHVKRRAGIGSTEETVQAVRATLESLAERVSPLDVENVRKLPLEVAIYLHAKGPAEDASLEAYLERVARRSGLELAEATRRARVVISVVAEATGRRAVRHLRERLPPEWGLLFEPVEEHRPRA